MTHSADLKSHSSNLELSVAEFNKISAILRDQAGITLADGGEKLVISRLTKQLSRLGLSSFSSYLKHVTSPAGADDLVRMVEAMTTNTTRFFREPEHFETLAEDAMPRIIRKARAGGRVRLWSAACSTGEEAYSIAATVLKSFPDVARYDVRILATDINHAVLAHGTAGQYESRLASDIPPEMRNLMFEADGEDDRVRIRSSLRELVTFRYLNFVEPWPVSGPFDIIFCRNVAIYMDEAMQGRLWSGLESVLHDDGLLFIGHSERLGPGLSDRLQLFATTSFRRPQKISRSSYEQMEGR